MAKYRKHTTETLYNCECQRCAGNAHSPMEEVEFIDLPTRGDEGSVALKFSEHVCPKCGPQLLIEAPSAFLGYVDEALALLDVSKNNKNVVVKALEE